MLIFVSASAPSSDRLLAAALPRLREVLPGARFVGPVGPLCRALGVEGPSDGPTEVHDVSGIGPWLAALPRGLGQLAALRRAALASDLALLVDAHAPAEVNHADGLGRRGHHRVKFGFG